MASQTIDNYLFKSFAISKLHIIAPILEMPHNGSEMWNIMTSSNGNIFSVAGHFNGEFPGHRWIPRTKASDAELWWFFICAWLNGWVNNREAGDLGRHRGHNDVFVMKLLVSFQHICLALWKMWPIHYYNICVNDWQLWCIWCLSRETFLSDAIWI